MCSIELFEIELSICIKIDLTLNNCYTGTIHTVTLFSMTQVKI